MHQFGGVTHRVGRNGVLPVLVQRAGRKGRSHCVKTEFGKKLVPERKQLVCIQSERQTYIYFILNPRCVDKFFYFIKFISVNIPRFVRAFARYRLRTAIPRDKFAPVRKDVYGKVAFVPAPVAGDGSRLVRKFP